MVRYRRAWSESPEALFFITYVTANRRPKFQTREDFLVQWKVWIEVLKPVAGDLFAWVFLPNHGHVIIKQGSRSFSKSVANFKRRVSLELGRGPASGKPGLEGTKLNPGFGETGLYVVQPSANSIWQPRYWEHSIRDDNDLQSHTDYIHYNPVKHGFCNTAWDYKYSSFHQFVSRGIYPKDWGSDVDFQATGEPESL